MSTPLTWATLMLSSRIAFCPLARTIAMPAREWQRCPRQQPGSASPRKRYKLRPRRGPHGGGRPEIHAKGATYEDPLFRRLQTRRPEGRQRRRRRVGRGQGHPACRPRRSDQRPHRALFQLSPEARAGGGAGPDDPALQRAHPPAIAEADHDRLHGGQLHGRRHPQGAGADQRLPQIPLRDYRPGRHDGAARCAGDDLRGRSGDGRHHRQALQPCEGGRRDELHLRLHQLHRRLGARPAAFRQRLLPDEIARHLAPIGPWIVTSDEIKDPQKLQIRLWNNGQLMQNFNTDDMGHKIPRCIEWLSSIHTLEPGDIIATGTNHRGLNPFMDGDKIELEVEGLGRLAFSVKDELKRKWERKTRLQMHEAAKEKTAGAYPDITPQTTGKYSKAA